MRQLKNSETSRRKFLGSIMPVCAVACVGCPGGLAMAGSTFSNAKRGLQDDIHPFDARYSNDLTWRQFMRYRWQALILLGKWMKEDMGSENALEYLKKFSSNLMFERGQAQARKSANKSLRDYTEQFRNIDNYKNVLVMEIVEDTEKAFELKVTGCLSASTFLDADAGDLGRALVCHADYAWAEGFNPRIKLVRDKTIMQGDAYCNHRYVWTE